MTDDEFTPFADRLVEHFAAEYAAAGGGTHADGVVRARQRIADLLPDGPSTPLMLLLVAETETAGLAGTVGNLWIGLEAPNAAGDTAWIWEIEVVPAHRGQGLGRALLTAAEEIVRSHGASAMELNVFAPNAAARRLYESTGYAVTTLQMRKQL